MILTFYMTLGKGVVNGMENLRLVEYIKKRYGLSVVYVESLLNPADFYSRMRLGPRSKVSLTQAIRNYMHPSLHLTDHGPSVVSSFTHLPAD